jgi:hypothetical protein
MGMYNTHKLNKLKTRLEEVEVQQTQLVCITLDTCKKLNHTAKLTLLLKNLYEHSSLANPAFTLTKLGISWHKLDNEHHRIMNALKMVHMHCLSMDLLSPESIKEIFDSIVNWAAQN